MSTAATGINFEPTRFVLPNGVTVLAQENPASPAVTVSIQLAAGAAFETRETMGMSGFAAAMLKRGTAKRSKEEIGELLDFTGALLSAGASRHTAGMGTKSRAADFASWRKWVSSYQNFRPVRAVSYVVVLKPSDLINIPASSNVLYMDGHVE